MRRLENYVRKYGAVAGPKLFHALQSQAAHAGVSARLRRKLDSLEGRVRAPAKAESYPLFEAAETVAPAGADPSAA